MLLGPKVVASAIDTPSNMLIGGSIVAEFVRRHSIARPQKTPNRRKHLSDISYKTYTLSYFVTNVVHHTAHFLFRPRGLHVNFLGRLRQTEGGNDAIGLF